MLKIAGMLLGEDREHVRRILRLQMSYKQLYNSADVHAVSCSHYGELHFYKSEVNKTLPRESRPLLTIRSQP